MSLPAFRRDPLPFHCFFGFQGLLAIQFLNLRYLNACLMGLDPLELLKYLYQKLLHALYLQGDGHRLVKKSLRYLEEGLVFARDQVDLLR